MRLFLFALAVASVARAGDPVEIHLDRPIKKGAKFTIESHLERISDNSMGGRAEKTERVIDLKGVVEVTEVDAKGRVARATCKVEKCTTTTDGGAPAETLPAGHVISLEAKGGKLEAALGKGDLDKYVAELLAGFELTDSALTWTITKSVAQGAAPAAFVFSDTMDAHQTLEGNMGGGPMTVEFKEKTKRKITLRLAK